jgi:hypothetical protein
MAAVAVAGIVAAMSVQMVTAGVDRARGRAAARYLAARVAAAKLQALSRVADVALRFEQRGGRVLFGTVIDGPSRLRDHIGTPTARTTRDTAMTVTPRVEID